MAPQEVNLTQEDLEWIQKYDKADLRYSETSKEKMVRKIKENPMVPIGCLATAIALGAGLYNFRSGNPKMSQMMMRARILAQGFTVTALIVGVTMTYGKKE